MDPNLIPHIEATMPKFNPVLVEGFHQKEFENGVHYYDNALKMIFRSIIKRDVFFRGVFRVPPREFLEYLGKSSAKIFDIHKETLYPVKLMFEYKDKAGNMIKFNPVYQMLPYTDVYGDLWLRGTNYSLQYVLAERGLPVTKENALFVKVLGFKFKIGVENFKYDRVFTETANNLTRTDDINLAANRFYSPTEARKIKDTKTPTPLLAWYIFANMGFSKAMKEYGECDFEIGSVDALISECRPEDRWEIITRSSSPNTKYIGDFIGNDYAIAVRNKSSKRKELSSMALQYACALLFVIDCCSSYFDISAIDNPDYWKLIIGRCTVKAGDSNESVMRLMNDHFDSINDYLDEDSIKKFASQSIVVSNMFELFNYIIANRSEIVQTTDRASMLHKELASLEFTLDKLITAANNFKHDIKNNSDLSQKKVARMLTNNFHIKEIDNARTTNLIQEPTPSDNPFIDYGLGCMPQHKVYTGSGNKKKRGDFDVTDSACFTHASVPFVNSFLRVTNPYPDGRGYLTPCLYLINGKVTAVAPEFMDRYKATAHRLKYRMPDLKA